MSRRFRVEGLGFKVEGIECRRNEEEEGSAAVQGYLAQKKLLPSRTLQ